MPPGIEKRTVCRLSGLLPSPFCPHTMEEYFIAGTEPKKPDDIYQLFLIDTRNGLLANKFCDQRFVEEKAIAVFPKEVEKWARENGWPSPPLIESPPCKGPPESLQPLKPPRPQSWIEITRPRPFDSYKLDPLIPDREEKIIFEAHASPEIREVDWYVNGEKIGTAVAPDFRSSWSPVPGTFRVEARSGTLQAAQSFEVVK
jgi:membrane carboxypeptidase/penicillin-binding protein PbpC